MSTEYERTICKSAERHQKRGESDIRKSTPQRNTENAYGCNLGPISKTTALSQAALIIPSFQEYAQKATDIEKMEQDLMQMQMERAKSQALYEKLCA